MILPIIHYKIDAHRPDLPAWGDWTPDGRELFARIREELPGVMERNGYGKPYAKAIFKPDRAGIVFYHSDHISPRPLPGDSGVLSAGGNAACGKQEHEKPGISPCDGISCDELNGKHAEISDTGAEISTISPRMDSCTTEEEKCAKIDYSANSDFLLARSPQGSGVNIALWICYQLEWHRVRRFYIVDGAAGEEFQRYCRGRGIEVCRA